MRRIGISVSLLAIVGLLNACGDAGKQSEQNELAKKAAILGSKEKINEKLEEKVGYWYSKNNSNGDLFISHSGEAKITVSCNDKFDNSRCLTNYSFLNIDLDCAIFDGKIKCKEVVNLIDAEPKKRTAFLQFLFSDKDQVDILIYDARDGTPLFAEGYMFLGRDLSKIERPGQQEIDPSKLPRQANF